MLSNYQILVFVTIGGTWNKAYKGNKDIFAHAIEEAKEDSYRVAYY
jgi:hypothetical protein